MSETSSALCNWPRCRRDLLDRGGLIFPRIPCFLRFGPLFAIFFRVAIFRARAGPTFVFLTGAHKFSLRLPPAESTFSFLIQLGRRSGASKTIYPCLRSTPSAIFCPRPFFALIHGQSGHVSVLVLVQGKREQIITNFRMRANYLSALKCMNK